MNDFGKRGSPFLVDQISEPLCDGGYAFGIQCPFQGRHTERGQEGSEGFLDPAHAADSGSVANPVQCGRFWGADSDWRIGGRGLLHGGSFRTAFHEKSDADAPQGYLSSRNVGDNLRNLHGLRRRVVGLGGGLEGKVVRMAQPAKIGVKPPLHGRRTHGPA